MAVMHSSPVCLVTIFILDHLEVEFAVASVGFAVDVPSGFAAACGGNATEKWLTGDSVPLAAHCKSLSQQPIVLNSPEHFEHCNGTKVFGICTMNGNY